MSDQLNKFALKCSRHTIGKRWMSTDCIYLDLGKVLVKVSHKKFMWKLENMKELIRKIKEWMRLVPRRKRNEGSDKR